MALADKGEIITRLQIDCCANLHRLQSGSRWFLSPGVGCRALFHHAARQHCRVDLPQLAVADKRKTVLRSRLLSSFVLNRCCHGWKGPRLDCKCRWIALRICSLFRPLHNGGADDWASRAGLRFCTEL